MRCRLCDSSRLRLSFRSRNTPLSISRLLKKEDLARDRSVSFSVYTCQECGFIQAPNMLKKDYYDVFPMSWSHCSDMRAYRQEQVSSMVKRFALKGKTVVEIGCGDGDYLEMLKRNGVRAVGVEPSRVMRHLALSKGLKVLGGYVGSGRRIKGHPYDAFMTRQVLEHIDDMHGFLRSIRLSLKDGAVGLVEVPNTHKDIAYKRFYNFYPDHLGFFCKATLRAILERNGFSVLNIEEGMNGEFLQAFVSYTAAEDISFLGRELDLMTSNLHALIRGAKKSGKRIAMWGAGYKGNMLMAVARVSDVQYVVDSDVSKHGLFTPVSHLPIVAPQHLNSEPVDIIVVTSMSYANEVIEQIRKKWGFKGEVVTLYQLSRSNKI